MIFDKRDEKSMMMKRQEQMMRSGVKPKEKKLREEEEEEGNKIISVGKMYGREKSWIDMIVLFFFLSRLRQPDSQILHKWTRKIY